MARRLMDPYWNWEGRRDARRLQGRLPELARKELLTEAAGRLRPAFDEYVTVFSVAGAAVSLETSALATVLCEIIRPRRVLDLGSGFSSYVFRRYAAAARPEAEVWSIDDSSFWLEKTREFLDSRGLSAENLLLWDSFSSQDNGAFDLILVDIGDFEFRSANIDKALALGSPSAVVILDDMHKPWYRASVAKALQRSRRDSDRRYEFYSARSMTKDQFGRYAAVLL